MPFVLLAIVSFKAYSGCRYEHDYHIFVYIKYVMFCIFVYQKCVFLYESTAKIRVKDFSGNFKQLPNKIRSFRRYMLIRMKHINCSLGICSTNFDCHKHTSEKTMKSIRFINYLKAADSPSDLKFTARQSGSMHFWQKMCRRRSTTQLQEENFQRSKYISAKTKCRNYSRQRFFSFLLK